MAFEPEVQGTGNLTADPELRYTASGIPVVNLRAALNDSRPESNGDKAIPTLYGELTVWRALAENVSVSLKKGDRILFGKWSGTEVTIDGTEMLIMKESEILGIIA